MLIEGVSIPQTCGETHGVLWPSTHCLSLVSHNAGNHCALEAKEVFAVFAELRKAIPIIIEVLKQYKSKDELWSNLPDIQITNPSNKIG